MRFLGILFFLTNPSGARDSQMNLDIAVLEISFGIDLNRHTSATDSDWPTFFLYHEPQETAENRLSQCTKTRFQVDPTSRKVSWRDLSFGRAPSDANGANLKSWFTPKGDANRSQKEWQTLQNLQTWYELWNIHWNRHIKSNNST